MNYIYAACGAIILLFIVQIGQRKGKNKADYLLILLNVIIGLFLLSDSLVNWKLSSETVILQNGVPLVLFPVFVFYVLQFINTKKKINKAWYCLFLPVVAFSLLSFVDHYLLGSYTTSVEIEKHFSDPHLVYHVIFKSSQLLFIFTLSYLLKELRVFEKSLLKGYSSIETIDVKWLVNFTYIYLGSLIITLILFLSANLNLIPIDIKQVFGIIYGILVASVFYLNYHGIRHYTLAQNENKVILDKSAETSKTKKQKTTTEKTNYKLEDSLFNLIETEQLYLEPKLSLPDLAEYLGESKHTVSKVINADGRSFYDLINGYRVNHFKTLLSDSKNQNFTLLALGLESGFNSKASFNRVFKNVTGETPKQYMERESHSIT